MFVRFLDKWSVSLSAYKVQCNYYSEPLLARGMYSQPLLSQHLMPTIQDRCQSVFLQCIFLSAWCLQVQLFLSESPFDCMQKVKIKRYTPKELCPLMGQYDLTWPPLSRQNLTSHSNNRSVTFLCMKLQHSRRIIKWIYTPLLQAKRL